MDISYSVLVSKHGDAINHIVDSPVLHSSSVLCESCVENNERFSYKVFFVARETSDAKTVDTGCVLHTVQ